MPQSIYFDKTRNTFFSADGVELFAFHDFAESRLSYQLFLSRPFADEEETRESLLPVSGMKGQHSLLAKVTYGAEFDGAKVSFTYYRPQYEFDIAPELLASDGEFYSQAIVSSFEYNQYDWSFSAEYLRLKFKVLGVIPSDSPVSAFFTRPLYGEAYYFQLVYRISERWDTYLRHDNSKDRARGDAGSYSYDTNMGFSFRPDNHWLIRAEVHYLEGTLNLLTRDNPPPRTEYWNAVLLQLAYKW